MVGGFPGAAAPSRAEETGGDVSVVDTKTGVRTKPIKGPATPATVGETAERERRSSAVLALPMVRIHQSCRPGARQQYPEYSPERAHEGRGGIRPEAPREAQIAGAWPVKVRAPFQVSPERAMEYGAALVEWRAAIGVIASSVFMAGRNLNVPHRTKSCGSVRIGSNSPARCDRWRMGG